MYYPLLLLHGATRWLLLATLLLSIGRAATGLRNGRPFGRTDNLLRHGTATVGHVQLLLGIGLWAQSPIARAGASAGSDARFFGALHPLLMLAALVVLSIGSALTKHRLGDRGRYRTMATWYALALLLILVAIPWPFSPLAARPYFRMPL